MRRLEELASTVRQNTCPSLLRATLLDYQAGRPVHFGPAVRVDGSGLTVGTRLLPWPQLGNLLPPYPGGNLIVVHRNGRDRLLAGNVAQVPNYFVLHALVRHVLSSGQAATAP